MCAMRNVCHAAREELTGIYKKEITPIPPEDELSMSSITAKNSIKITEKSLKRLIYIH